MGSLYEGQGAYNWILKKVPQNKVSNTADQNTFWRYFGGGGEGGLITELILKKVFRNKVLKTADQNTFWRYLFFYASMEVSKKLDIGAI